MEISLGGCDAIDGLAGREILKQRAATHSKLKESNLLTPFSKDNNFSLESYFFAHLSYLLIQKTLRNICGGK